MADNVRFHSKFHGKAHHSEYTPGYHDSGSDPVASKDAPFQGNFYSASGIYAGYGTGVAEISAPTIRTAKLLLGNSAYTLTEAVANQFVRVPQGATPAFGVNINAGDPYWDKVVFYTDFAGTHLDQAATDLSLKGLSMTFYGGGSANGAPYITSADAKFGSTSLFIPGLTGAVHVNGLTQLLSGSASEPTNSWAIEFWCKSTVAGTNKPPFAINVPYDSSISTSEYTQLFGLEIDTLSNSSDPFRGTVLQSTYKADNCNHCASDACCLPPTTTGITQVSSFTHSQSAILSTYKNYCSTRYDSTDSTAVTAITSTSVGINNWHHVAMTDDGVVGRLFVDGKLASYFKTTVCAGNFIGLSEAPLFIIGSSNPHDHPGQTSQHFWTGYIDTFRVTRNAARYTVNFIPQQQAPPVTTFLPPNSIEYDCAATTVLADTYGTELQFKAILAGDNVTFACTQSSIKVHANVPGLKGTLFTATCAMPTSGTPVTIPHNLAATPEIVKVTAQVIPQIYPASDPAPYLVDDELDIQSFERTRALTSTALSSLTGLHWDELYSYVIGPSSITISRNIDNYGSGTAPTSADERLSFVTKSGSRHYAADESELSSSFKIKVSLIQGGLNYPGALNQSDEIYVDGTDNSLFEWSAYNQGVRKRYLRVRTDGIKDHHVDDKQIKTHHLDDKQVTTRTLEDVGTAGTYTHPQITVDAKGRITSATSQAAASSLSGLGSTSESDIKDVAFRPVDLHFNDPSNYEPPMSVETTRISPSGTFGNWASGSYSDIPYHSLTANIGLYDPYIVKLPAGKKRVKIKCWGAGGGGNVNATPSYYVYNGGSGGYSENTFTIDDNIKELTVWIGKGGRTADYGLSGTMGTESASSRPTPLSAIIAEVDPIGGIYYDQMHPPGCGGDTFVTVEGVSGNPVTIIKAYGGGTVHRLSADYVALTGSSDWTERRAVTSSAGAGRSSTSISTTNRTVQDTAGNTVTGAVIFFTDPFDTGFSTAWAAGNNSLSALEPVIGFEVPAVADVNVSNPSFSASVVESYYMNDTSGVALTAFHSKFKPHWTFSVAGEPGIGIYQDVNVCLPTVAPAGSPCWILLPERGSVSFGSNRGSYGTGGVYNSRNQPDFSNPDIGIMEHGHDGGCVVEIL